MSKPYAIPGPSASSHVEPYESVETYHIARTCSKDGITHVFWRDAPGDAPRTAGAEYVDSCGESWTVHVLNPRIPLQEIRDFRALAAQALELAERSIASRVPLPPEVGPVPLLKMLGDAYRVAEALALEVIDVRRERDMYKRVICAKGGPDRDETTGKVYFIQTLAESGLVKIGYSIHPKVRLRALQSASGHRLRLLHAEPGSMQDETALHRRFAKHRTEGEWFHPVPELLEYIESRRVVGNSNAKRTSA